MDIYDKKMAGVAGLALLCLGILIASPFFWGARNASKFRDNWAKESDEFSILEISDSHIVQRSKDRSVIYRYTTPPAGTCIFVEGERGSVEVNGDRMIIGTGKFAGIYRRLANYKPSAPTEAASVTLGKKLEALETRKKSVTQKYNVLVQEVVDLQNALRRLSVRGSDDLTTPQSKRLSKELAEVTLQQRDLNIQHGEIGKALDEGRSLQRRLAREEMVNNGKISNEQMRQQLGELTEILVKLDEKFTNTGTVTAQDAINKIVDEQLK
jgi:hypothetical protein